MAKSKPRLHSKGTFIFHKTIQDARGLNVHSIIGPTVLQIQDLERELCFPSANAGHPRNARTWSAQHLGDWMSKIGSISDDLALAWKIEFTGKRADEVRHEVGWLVRCEDFSLLSLANLKAKRISKTVPRSKYQEERLPQDCQSLSCFHSACLTL